MIIGGQTYELRWTLKGLFLYEQASGHPYPAAPGLMDTYLLFYGMVYASNQDFPLTFDAFIDECDKDSTLFTQFVKLMEERSEREAQFKKKVTAAESL